MIMMMVIISIRVISVTNIIINIIIIIVIILSAPLLPTYSSNRSPLSRVTATINAFYRGQHTFISR